MLTVPFRLASEGWPSSRSRNTYHESWRNCLVHTPIHQELSHLILSSWYGPMLPLCSLCLMASPKMSVARCMAALLPACPLLGLTLYEAQLRASKTVLLYISRLYSSSYQVSLSPASLSTPVLLPCQIVRLVAQSTPYSFITKQSNFIMHFSRSTTAALVALLPASTLAQTSVTRRLDLGA